MSNRSVLERLEQELQQYVAGHHTSDGIGKLLDSHIEALEGIPYSVVIEMRHYRYLLETEDAYDQEDCQSKSNEVVASVIDWIHRLMVDHA
jgi:hypothetical protein